MVATASSRGIPPVEILDFEDLLPTANRDLAEMRAELRQVCEDVANPYLSRLLDRMFSDEQFDATFS